MSTLSLTLPSTESKEKSFLLGSQRKSYLVAVENNLVFLLFLEKKSVFITRSF